MSLVSHPRYCISLKHFVATPQRRSTSRRSKIQINCTSNIYGSYNVQKKKTDVAVLWFKHDLRVDDHPALVSASQSFHSLLPLYVFDYRILSRFSDEMLELLLFAIEDLRKSLKDQGSDLMIRFGNAEKVICELVKEVRATKVFAEKEVEYELCKMMESVKDTLEAISIPGLIPEISLWGTPFYNIKSLEDLPASHCDFMKLQLSVTPPTVTLILPKTEANLDWGAMPDVDDLKKFMSAYQCKFRETWKSNKDTSAETILLRQQRKQTALSDNLMNELASLSGEGNQNNINNKRNCIKQSTNSAFVTKHGNHVGGGTSSALNALAAYLRYLEGTSRDDWQEVHEKLRNAETREGASFDTLFGPALALGIISRRRVYHEAIKYERERNAGFLSPFGYSTVTIAAAVNAVISAEWYWLLSLSSQINTEGSFSVRIWRWKGYLIQYTTIGHEGPAIILVHGFGAFSEHYRDNFNEIARGRNRVWAITLLGFGKSEKPNVIYSELMWAELLRDFIIEVIGGPAHLVGNSIGGYIVSIVAGLWPALVKSVTLINSAGDVIPGYSSVPFSKEKGPSRPARLGARLLLPFLRLGIRSTVNNCYPVKTDRVDDWLITELIRASHDPGVIAVLESVFSFNLSIPLNFLLERYSDKVLVIQGMKDPIADSKSKLAMFREHCVGTVIIELDAGHCPHDELPEEVNSIILEWVVSVEAKLIRV